MTDAGQSYRTNLRTEVSELVQITVTSPIVDKPEIEA